MSNSPGIILTCQYTLPNQNSFGAYLEYMTREEALENISNRTLDEEIELQEVKSKIYNFEFFNDSESVHAETIKSKIVSDIELEASGILKHSVDIEKLGEQDFSAYISYMARQYALEKKPHLTTAESIEQEKISEALKKMNQDSFVEKTPDFLPGVFSCSSDQVSVADLKEIKGVFRKGQNHGSVIYQDVISHDNSYLEKLGLYDPKTEVLDEAGLKRAGKEMMDRLFEKEKLTDTGFWMASIHRNTNHIHIHFAVVESRNTRPTVSEKINGEILTMPKGKRKQSTLDEMKTAYSQELNRYSFEIGQQKLIDRGALLTRKSDLRNILVKEVKEPRRYDQKALRLLNEVYQGLPEKRSEWNYGNESRTKLSPEIRFKLDQLTEHILTSDIRYEEYNAISDQLKKDAKETFGESKRSGKDAQSNAIFDLKKRTGNAILTSLKKQDQQMFELIQEAQNLNKEKSIPDKHQEQQVPNRTKEETRSVRTNENLSPNTEVGQKVQKMNGASSVDTIHEKPKEENYGLTILSSNEETYKSSFYGTDKSSNKSMDETFSSSNSTKFFKGTSNKKGTFKSSKNYFETLKGKKSKRPIISNRNRRKTTHTEDEKVITTKFKRQQLTKRSLRHVSDTIEAHEEKYQAQRAYEIQQRRIQYEQERR